MLRLPAGRSFRSGSETQRSQDAPARSVLGEAPWWPNARAEPTVVTLSARLSCALTVGLVSGLAVCEVKGFGFSAELLYKSSHKAR
jgi:hypothetical protein